MGAEKHKVAISRASHASCGWNMGNVPFFYIYINYFFSSLGPLNSSCQMKNY